MTAAPAPAVVFPGETGAVAGMLGPWLYDPPADEVFAEASEVVGRDVLAWWRDPLNLVDPTAAHLAVVVTGVAGARSLAARGLRPIAVAGHGVGEYAALVAAGALPLAQVVELVHHRAELLSLTPRPSCAGMAALIGPRAGEVARAVLAGRSGALTVACFDGPRQVVLSGDREELSRVRQEVLAAGLSLVRLPGRAACHGPLMRPVAVRLDVALADLDWSTPSVPVVPNAIPVPTRDPGRLADCLRAHLVSPVQWEQTVTELVLLGATAVVEIGSFPVLGPLVHQVHPSLPVHLATRPRSALPEAAPEPVLAGPPPLRGES